MREDDEDEIPVVQAHPGNHPMVINTKIAKIPSKVDRDYAVKMAQAREEHISSSTMVHGAKKGDAVAVLTQISTYLAKNIELLEFRKQFLEAQGADTTHVITKQSELLKQLASIQFDLRKQKIDTVDFNSPHFIKLSKFIVEQIVAVAKETLSPEDVDIFIQRLSTEMEGFGEKLEVYMNQHG